MTAEIGFLFLLLMVMVYFFMTEKTACGSDSISGTGCADPDGLPQPGRGLHGLRLVRRHHHAFYFHCQRCTPSHWACRSDWKPGSHDVGKPGDSADCHDNAGGGRAFRLYEQYRGHGCTLAGGGRHCTPSQTLSFAPLHAARLWCHSGRHHDVRGNPTQHSSGVDASGAWPGTLQSFRLHSCGSCVADFRNPFHGYHRAKTSSRTCPEGSFGRSPI